MQEAHQAHKPQTSDIVTSEYWCKQIEISHATTALINPTIFRYEVENLHANSSIHHYPALASCPTKQRSARGNTSAR
jgi:hypothetical protein